MQKIKYNQFYKNEMPSQADSIDFTLIKRLLKYLYPYRQLVFLTLCLMILARLIDVLIPVFIGKIAKYFLDNRMDPTALHTVIKGSLFILCGLLLSYLFDGINIIIRSWVGQNALFTLRNQVYKHIENLKISYFDQNPIGLLMTRTINDVDQINQMFSESLVQILGNFILLVFIAISVLILNWKVALFAFFVIPLTYWLTKNFRNNQRRCYNLIRSIVSALNIFVQEHLMGMTTIRNFGLQKIEREKFQKINEDHATANVESIRNFSFFIAGLDFLQNLVLIIIFTTLVYFAPKETGFRADTYFTFSLYAIIVFRPLLDLADRYNILQSAMAASERVFNILDEPIETKEGLDLPFKEIQTIEFKDVWFAYENNHWILKGLNLTIRKGESVAIVGATGAGKTTLINLLLRFYEFQKGSILVNGIDIKTFKFRSLRKLFSIILQDPVIFSGTIAENISLYNPHITEKKIYEVIDYINLDSLIERNPEKIHYQLKERGTNLSVGEAQLIALARAIAHEQSFLILDEATANIDSLTEKVIQEALKKVLKQKTSLVIAHRLSTIQDVDKIVVINEGVIAESGTHQELLEKKGIYEKLFRLQFIDT